MLVDVLSGEGLLPGSRRLAFCCALSWWKEEQALSTQLIAPGVSPFIAITGMLGLQHVNLGDSGTAFIISFFPTTLDLLCPFSGFLC